MDPLTFILSWIVSLITFLFRRTSRPATTIAPQPPVLNVPPEIFHCIADFLPLESAVAFSLTCRHIYYITGPRYFKVLKAKSFDRTRFLMLIERDLPNYIFCRCCQKLHDINKAHRHTSNTERPSDQKDLACREAEREVFVSDFVCPNFSTTVFQMVMKLHRQGRDTSKLLALLSSSYTGWFPEDTAMADYIPSTQISEARIVYGSLFLRHQQSFHIPPPFWQIHICPHINIRNDGERPGVNSIHIGNWRNCWWRHRPNDGLRQCETCITEFRLDFNPSLTRIYVTKWLDLGDGDLSNWRWRSHNYNRTMPLDLPRRIMFERGSVCAGFEGKHPSEFKYDSLL